VAVAARVPRHGAAAARHVETNADMVYTNCLDDIVHMLGPFVGGWDQGLEIRDLLPTAARPPRIAELPVEHLDVLAVIARQPGRAGLFAQHICQRVVGLPPLGRMLPHPLPERLPTTAAPPWMPTTPPLLASSFNTSSGMPTPDTALIEAWLQTTGTLLASI